MQDVRRCRNDLRGRRNDGRRMQDVRGCRNDLRGHKNDVRRGGNDVMGIGMTAGG